MEPKSKVLLKKGQDLIIWRIDKWSFKLPWQHWQLKIKLLIIKQAYCVRLHILQQWSIAIWKAENYWEAMSITHIAVVVLLLPTCGYVELPQSAEKVIDHSVQKMNMSIAITVLQRSSSEMHHFIVKKVYFCLSRELIRSYVRYKYWCSCFVTTTVIDYSTAQMSSINAPPNWRIWGLSFVVNRWRFLSNAAAASTASGTAQNLKRVLRALPL